MKLQDYLRRHQLSPKAFAERINVSSVTVTRYMTGARRPDWDVMSRIVDATDGAVTADDFLTVERVRRRGNPVAAVA